MALLNVEVDEFNRVDGVFIGSHILLSHARNDHVEISSIAVITQTQLPAGYVCKNDRRINEIVIGTRLR